jgi:mono/diheme cytochrome c family protein
MPRPILYVLLVVVALSLIPMGLVYKARQSSKAQTRIQVVHDMDNQGSYKPQTQSDFFADGQSMRKAPSGTVARGLLNDSDAFYRGVERDSVFISEFPLEVTADLIDRGQERFNIYCAPCHGQSGNGSGIVHKRAAELAEGTWTPPTDLSGRSIMDKPVGDIYNTITNGVRNMPGYAAQIPPRDRWAITAYVRALQLSRNAGVDDVPQEKLPQQTVE